MNNNTSQNQLITLTNELGKGGEATVYHIAEQNDLVAKIYHNPTPAREAKLRAMLVNPPEQPSTHVAIAWPIALLYQQDSRMFSIVPNTHSDINELETINMEQFVGFLMPKITGGRSIFHIYNPILREQLPYPFGQRMLYRTAYNLCAVVAGIHAKGYVIGDINESNILVNHEALVTLVDCDSFQVMDEAGIIYRCQVGKPEFTPPELQRINFKEVDQCPEHDLFGLGVLLFQLLMNGFHPFAGVLSSNQSVGRVDLYAIRQGLFPYAENQPSIVPPPSAPLIRWLHPKIQRRFWYCFIAGHQQPTNRPTAIQWYHQFNETETLLLTCDAGNHIYNNHLTDCPYCQQNLVEQTKQKFHFNPNTIPIDVTILMAKGVQAYQQNQPEMVLTWMNQVVEGPYRLAEAYAYRAWAYLQQDDVKKALAEAQYAVKLAPNLGLAHDVLGRCFVELKQYNEATSALTQALQCGVDDPYQVYYWRGMAQKTVAQAEVDFRQALHTPSNYWRMLAYQQLERLEPTNYEALPVFAHPPSGVSFQENETEQIFTVTVPIWKRFGSLGLFLLFNIAILFACYFTLETQSFFIPYLFMATVMLGYALLRPHTMVKKRVTHPTYKLTLKEQTLTIVKNGKKDAPTRYNTRYIQHLYCHRVFGDGEFRSTSYQLWMVLSNQNKHQLLLSTYNYRMARYVDWKLRHYLNLPDTTVQTEYIPSKPGKANVKRFGILSILFDLFILSLLIMGCMGADYMVNLEYDEWQELLMIQESHFLATGTVTGKSHTSSKNIDTYSLSYRYQVETANGNTITSFGYERVGETFYKSVDTGSAIEIIYATQDPWVGRLANEFSNRDVRSAYGRYVFWGTLRFIGAVIVFGAIISGIHRIWLVFALGWQGKVITGIVSDTKHRTWISKNGRNHAYDIYYRYLGYEAMFQTSESVFKTLSKGDTLEVIYLPTKPHISRPHPLKRYYKKIL